MEEVRWLRRESEDARTKSGRLTYLPMAVSSLVVAVDAVVGRRWRDSCRRFVTPLSLLNDALDLEAFWLLEKLLLDVSKRLLVLNMVATAT